MVHVGEAVQGSIEGLASVEARFALTRVRHRASMVHMPGVLRGGQAASPSSLPEDFWARPDRSGGSATALTLIARPLRRRLRRAPIDWTCLKPGRQSSPREVRLAHKRGCQSREEK
jgi:hypothetical protein